LHYKAILDAPLHVHVDPLISGGVGSTIGSHAQPEGDISGVLQVVSVTGANDARALAVRTALDRQELQLEVKSDAKFKVSDLKLEALGGWTKVPGFTISVPEFGVRTTIALGADSVPSLVFFDNSLRLILLSSAASRSEGPRVRGPEQPCYLTISPDVVFSNAEGLRIQCTVSAVVMNAQQATDRITTVKTGLKGQQKNSLSNLGKIEVRLGNLEFGENNDFYKFVTGVVKELNDVARTAKQSGKKIEVELGHAGHEMEKAAQQFKHNPGKALESFAQQRKKDAQKVIDAANPANWFR
jgi:hypothetical protein